MKASKGSQPSVRDLRQAKPAKRYVLRAGERKPYLRVVVSIRPMAGMESADLVTASDPVEIPPSKRMPASMQARGAFEEEIDELWPDTPRPTRVSKSLVLDMLDMEAEEAAEGGDEMEDDAGDEPEDNGKLSGWLDDSPPPKRVGTKHASARAKGKGKASPVAAAPPVVASVRGPAANALGGSAPASSPGHR